MMDEQIGDYLLLGQDLLAGALGVLKLSINFIVYLKTYLGEIILRGVVSLEELSLRHVGLVLVALAATVLGEEVAALARSRGLGLGLARLLVRVG